MLIQFLFALLPFFAFAQVTWVAAVNDGSASGTSARMAYSSDGVQYTIVDTPFSSYLTTT